MPYTFDDIIFQYDASKYMLRRQIITRAEHNRTIRTLNAEQEKRDVAEQLRLLAVRTAEAEKRKAEKRKAYNVKRKEQRARPKSNIASVEPFKQTMMRWLNGEEKENESLRFELPEDMLQRIQLKDKMTVQFDLVNGSDVLDSFSTTVSGKDISSIVHHYNYSDKVIGLKTDKKSQTRSIASMADIIMRSSDLRMTVFQPVIAKMRSQAFRDGVDHCFFMDIIKHFQELVKEATVTKTKRNRQAIVNKLEKMVVQYDKGVPEEIIEQVAHELDIGIVIHSISHHKLITANLKPKNKKFEFINSRMNHVEYLTVNMNSEAVMITKEEGMELIANHIKNRLYNWYTGTITNPQTILTTNQRYIVGNALSSTLCDFTNSFDRGCKLDYIKEKELCDFILSGTHLMINYKNMKCKGSPVAEIDMKKAYTQFQQCSVYQGFPAIINNVRDCDESHDVVTHNGVYQVSIISMIKTVHNAKKIELLHAYGFKNGSYVLTSPWIVKLRESGCLVNVLYGCWGKRMDFSFSQEMMDEKLYAIWTGMQMKRDDELHFKMACDAEFAEVVMAQHTEGNVEYNQATQTIMINKKKDYHYIMPHVSAFLVSYTQIAVFDEASKYHVSEIVAHKLDSIVLTRKPLPFDSTLWEDSTSEGIPMNKYTSNFIFSEKYIALTRGSSTPYLGDCFISGQGGSGKTQVIMSDIGFRSKFFVSLSWDLISDKIIEFSCRGASINQLLGFDIYNKKIQSYKDKRGSPGVIALDEMSMTNKDIVTRIKEMYPYSQLIMMGDYDKGKYYQSSLLTEGNQLYHPESYHLITSDFRSIDEETRTLKKEIRSLMDKGESLVGYLYSKIPSLSMEEIKKEYSMDYTMTGTHARIGHFTKELRSDKNWYKVIKHNFDDVIKKCAGSNDVYLHGQVLDFPIEGRTELTHAFTVHSFQGKTITNKKCYVDLSHLKCNADIYTAISRVRSIHQLRLVRSEYS